MEENDLPNLHKFVFVSKESKLIPGKNSVEFENNKPGDKSRISNSDVLGNLAIVSLFYQNWCYTDGTYNYNDWQVQSGILKGNEEFEAYTISPPQHKAKQFLASHHKMFFKFSNMEDYQVFSFENSSLSLISKIEASQISKNGYTLIPDFDLSKMETSKTYVFVPLSQKISMMTQISENVEGAKIYDNGSVKIEARIYSANFTPSIPEDFNSGPGGWENKFSTIRNFFLIVDRGTTSVFCQDQNQGKGHLIKFSSDFNSVTTIDFNIDNNFKLGAAVAGDAEIIFYILVEKKNAGDKLSTRKVFIVKADTTTGQELLRNQLDSSVNQLDIYELSTGCFLEYNGKEIAMYISRIKTKSRDGLNHQGGICVLFNSQTLEIIKNHGQTSGHSFGNSIVLLED